MAGIHQPALVNHDLSVRILLQLVPRKILGGRPRKYISAFIVTGPVAGALESIFAFFDDATQVGANRRYGPDALVVTVDKELMVRQVGKAVDGKIVFPADLKPLL